MELIDASVEGKLGRIVLNRPGKLNAMTQAMCYTFREAVERMSADDRIELVQVRGAGERAFCPGADIGEFAEHRKHGESARQFAEVFHGAVESLPACRHPTQAVIRGICVGGGFQLACACDLRICSEDSRFGVPVSRIGLAVDYRELRPIVRIAGESAALSLLLEGKLIGAEEALRLGLVHEVVAVESLEEAASAMAERVLAGAPLANRWHKKFIRRLADAQPLTPQEEEEPFDCFSTVDYREGWQAFVEKRPPVFRGI